MPDRYATMRTTDLEASAANRATPVDLSGATNNEQRAQRLRDADAAGNVESGQPTQSTTEPSGDEDGGDEGDVPVGNPDHPLGEAHAPYPSGGDVKHRLDAASGSDEHYERQDPPPGGMTGPQV